MGPLHGIKVVEFAGLGPVPFCGMVFSDLGAEVVQINRETSTTDANLFAANKNIPNRGRQLIALDIRSPEGRENALRLVDQADVLIEGFRPGVMERLGLGPEVCHARNPRLIYGRMTGWGQNGTLAQTAGHDINYLAISGALHAIGRAEGGPTPPLNLIADYGGGAMLLAVGILAALVEAKNSGQGQVVDAAMTDGSALLMAAIYSLKAMGQWVDQRASNFLDGGAHFYDTYQCADGKWLAVGPIEPHFYQLLLQGCGVVDPDPRQQWRAKSWPAMKEQLRAAFRTKMRDEWCAQLEVSDACVTPVLSLEEAPGHHHNQSRQTFVEVDGLVQPAPAPRFSRTPAAIQSAPATSVQAGEDWLVNWGFSADEIGRFKAASAI
ncbi:L-carnitine dehydratase/bile acid-inducible protein F [Candidatus Competibacter denitrificans Run_A_D11]|uniref:L-carnitine dehydratase/bile acid-inducible protein F n=1 Tax=Candidatus Competibacter denitrificans Run_A_D11 TaxID=1400863 RepID=W6MA67_9GAMM|nr:CaiB/BaiF CoA-transferase family protein [Candidatus Competibacter denitrificans]CDI03579.1 L-carnitine dehydratase/bile acid-inducible protein F [Candidatus Competibacter denitrificans Run_A_D11]